jgi:CRP/FNR family transcriptional regulator, cyclic AMP receptor protein
MGKEKRPWFDRISEADHQALVAAGRARTYAPRTVLVEEGQTSGLVIIILDGRVKITTLSTDGRETALSAIGRGEVIGELSAVDGYPHSATATAIDSVKAIVLSAPAFLEVVAQNGRLGIELLRAVTERLRAADRVRVEFGGRDVVQPVCSLLIQLARDHGDAADGGGIRISTRLSQEELATWLGASREAVNKALRRLRTLGLVETGRRQLLVRDVRRLERLAER